MTLLVVRICPIPGATLVTMAGEVDIATIGKLRAHLDAVPGHDTVVETSGVTLLSAAGMRALLDLQDRLTGAGARLVLAAPARPVWRVLTATGLDGRLPISTTVDEAVARLVPPASVPPPPTGCDDGRTVEARRRTDRLPGAEPGRSPWSRQGMRSSAAQRCRTWHPV